MFLLLAELNAHPSASTEVEKILRGLVEVARSEPGNVCYAVHRRVDDANAFVLYELYKNRLACDVHLAAESVQRALKQFETLLTAPPKIVFCDGISGFAKPM